MFLVVFARENTLVNSQSASITDEARANRERVEVEFKCDKLVRDGELAQRKLRQPPR